MSDSQKMKEITNGFSSDMLEGWILTKIGDIISVHSGEGLTGEQMNKTGKYPVYGGNGITGYHTEFLFEEKKLIIGRVGAKCGVVHITLPNCWITDNALIVDFYLVNMNFLYYSLINLNLNSYSVSSAQPVISGAKIYPLLFRLPPLPEQCLISTRVDLLFDHVKKAEESLDKIPLIMKRFRQAALKKAFSGELTAEWREQQQDLEPAAELLRRIREERKHLYTEEVKRAKDEGRKLPKKPKCSETEPLDNSDLPELPEEWVWSSLNELANTQPGFACGNKSVQDGLIHLRMNNISDECRLNMDLIRKVPLDFKIEKYLLKKGDLLFCHTNSSKLVGKNTIFNMDGDYAYSNHLTRIRVDSNIISSNWLWCILTIYWKEGRFEKDCKNWVNQSTLPNDKLIHLSIPLPPLPEQQEIVRRIESLFKFADETEKNAAEARKRVEIMTQSILARAFRGDLSADFREAVRNWKDLDAEARGRYVFVLPEEEREKVLNGDEFPIESSNRLLERIGEERTGNTRERKWDKSQCVDTASSTPAPQTASVRST
jgi:type I restriction enzyme S subunit